MGRSAKTKVIGYKFEGRFDELKVNKILEAATQRGTVTQHVAKHYADADYVWFNGFPGKDLRSVRDEIKKLITNLVVLKD